MMKIGIMGGTFNPVHNAHIKLALSAYEELNLDKVLFMPSKKPPHKDNNVILSDEVRSDMIKLAIKPYNFFEFSDFELIRNTTTYTSETLELLDINDDNTYYFIMGADSFINILNWNRPEVIMKHAHIVVSVRDGIDTDKLEEHMRYLCKNYNAKISILHIGFMDISSTYIRNSIKEGKDISEFMPEEVEEYIKSNKLYV